MVTTLLIEMIDLIYALEGMTGQLTTHPYPSHIIYSVLPLGIVFRAGNICIAQWQSPGLPLRGPGSSLWGLVSKQTKTSVFFIAIVKGGCLPNKYEMGESDSGIFTRTRGSRQEPALGWTSSQSEATPEDTAVTFCSGGS